MTVMVVVMMMIITGINKSPNSLCCFASYSATLTEGWNNFCRSLFLIVYMFLRVNIQIGGVVLQRV